MEAKIHKVEGVYSLDVEKIWWGRAKLTATFRNNRKVVAKLSRKALLKALTIQPGTSAFFKKNKLSQIQKAPDGSLQLFFSPGGGDKVIMEADDLKEALK
jgi:hypothetical protein